MPRFVYVQIDGIEKAARIEGDTVERQQATRLTQPDRGYETLIVKKGQAQVGEFKGESVIGWWIQDE